MAASLMVRFMRSTWPLVHGCTGLVRRCATPYSRQMRSKRCPVALGHRPHFSGPGGGSRGRKHGRWRLRREAAEQRCGPEPHAGPSQDVRPHRAVAPAEYTRTERLEQARTLLREQVGTVAKMCYRVGFNNPSYFSTAFSRGARRPPARAASAAPPRPTALILKAQPGK